jgi:hypothetical protein
MPRQTKYFEYLAIQSRMTALLRFLDISQLTKTINSSSPAADV